MTKNLIVITGASSGFGAEIAQTFNKKNYPLLLLGRRIEKIKSLPLDFSKIIIKQVDVTNYSDLKQSIQEAENVFGPTDLLINNAGIMLLGNVTTQSPNEWQTMLNTNIMGVLNGMQIVLPSMLKRNHGTIINISSLAGKKTFVNHAAYVASKFGVHGLSETIREEVSGKNVRISLVAPGAAETELLTHVTDQKCLTDYQAWKESMGGSTLDPKHIAEVVDFMYHMPQSVNIRELDIAATRQDG